MTGFSAGNDRRAKIFKGPERRIGTYVVVSYDQATMAELEKWTTAFQIPEMIALHKIHTTIIYSRAHLPQLHVEHLDRPMSFKAKGFRLFDSRGPRRKPGTKALVVVLEAPELESLHVQLRVLGATHDHDDYHPHLTLTYGCPQDFDLSSLVLPTFDFVPARIYGEPLDLMRIPSKVYAKDPE